MLRLSIFLLSIAISFQASALTLKSGETMKSGETLQSQDAEIATTAQVGNVCEEANTRPLNEAQSRDISNLSVATMFTDPIANIMPRFSTFSDGVEVPPLKGEHVGGEIKLIADFNNDNLDDVMIEFSMVNMPPIFLMSNGDGTFRTQHNISQEAARVQIRKAVAADFNNDGWLDVAGFTTADPWPKKGWSRGEPDILLMNEEGKRFRETDIPEWFRNDWNHGGDAADIDNDGLVDILPVSEEPKRVTGPLKNMGNNLFKKGKTSYSRMVTSQASSSVATGDLNADGFVDLVFAISPDTQRQGGFRKSHLKKNTIQIIFGDGDFDFRDNKKLSFGRHWLQDAQLDQIWDQADLYEHPTIVTAGSYNPNITKVGAGISNVELADINGDGRLDILAGYWYAPGPLQMSSGFKIYINYGDCFKNETDKYTPNQRLNRTLKPETQTSYIHNFFFEDISGDGLPDIVLQLDGTMNYEKSYIKTSPHIFINDGSYRYLPLKQVHAPRAGIDHFEIKNSLTSTSYHSVGDFDGDNRSDLLFVRSSFYKNQLHVMLQRTEAELQELRESREKSEKALEGAYPVSFFEAGTSQKIADAILRLRDAQFRLTDVEYSKARYRRSNLQRLTGFLLNSKKMILSGQIGSIETFGECAYFSAVFQENSEISNQIFDYGMPGKHNCRVSENLWPIIMKIGDRELLGQKLARNAAKKQALEDAKQELADKRKKQRLAEVAERERQRQELAAKREKQRLAEIAKKDRQKLDAISKLKGTYQLRLTQKSNGRILDWGTVTLSINQGELEIGGAFPNETKPHLENLSPQIDGNGILILSGKWRMAPFGHQCMEFHLDLTSNGSSINKCDTPEHKTEISYTRVD